MKDKIAFFDRIASPSKSAFSRYYWNDIISYCSYFSHDNIQVLEIGCGTGDLLSAIPGKRKTGIDFSPNMIEAAKKKHPGIEFHVMAAEDIQLEEKFDLI